MGKTIRRGLLLAGVALVLAAGAFVGGIVFQNRSASAAEPVITGELLASEIRGISQYAVLEYRYTNVGKFEDRVDFYGWQVPFTTKSFIITYDGAMRLGIEGTDIRVEILDKQIRVELPEIHILSHEIREDTLEVLDQTKNIFNQIQIEDYAGFAVDQKRVMEQKAREGGLFLEARALAEQHLGDFLRSLPGIREEYTIQFTIKE